MKQYEIEQLKNIKEQGGGCTGLECPDCPVIIRNLCGNPETDKLYFYKKVIDLLEEYL